MPKNNPRITATLHPTHHKELHNISDQEGISISRLISIAVQIFLRLWPAIRDEKPIVVDGEEFVPLILR